MKFGSDHYIHLKYINKFKLGKKKYGAILSASYNQRNAVYPVLFHWFLAHFFYKTATQKPNRIGLIINIISLISFNLFSFKLFGNQNWDYILKINLLYFLFPFSYIYWNAKNMGLSARGFGLLLGQLFTYCLVLYIEFDKSLIWLVMMTILSFVALLGSQFAFQYVIFISIVIFTFLLKLELLLPFLISIIAFRCFFPKLSKSFFKGQLNHKRNYALFLAPIYILKIRPSIYRDFIYDFWVKLRRLKKEKVQTLYYIYSNPIFELIYGFPFLWVLLYYYLNDKVIIQLNSFNLVIGASLAIFLLISLRPFRFLGEPQRYVEFVIPLISISFIYYVPQNIQLITSFSSIIFILLTKFIFHFFRAHSNHNHDEITGFLKDNFNEHTLISSNDNNFSKFLIPYFNVVKTDLTRYYKNIDEFDFYHNNDYTIQSVRGLVAFHKQYKLNLIIINSNLYAQTDMVKLHSEFNLKSINTINNYTIYKILDDKGIN